MAGMVRSPGCVGISRYSNTCFEDDWPPANSNSLRCDTPPDWTFAIGGSAGAVAACTPSKMIDNVKLSPAGTVARSTCARTPGAALANGALARRIAIKPSLSNSISQPHFCGKWHGTQVQVTIAKNITITF